MTAARRLVCALVLLVAGLGAGGCAIHAKPAITVGDAVRTETSADATRLEIDLTLENPGAEPLELLEFRYDVTVDGRRVYAGRRSAEATLGAKTTRTIRLPAVVPTTDGPLAWSVRGSLGYVVPGALADILLDTGVRRPKVGFRGQGRVE